MCWVQLPLIFFLLLQGVDSLSQGSTKTDKPKKKVNTTSSAKSATDAAVKSTTKGATDEGASIKSSKKLGAAPEKVSAAKKQKRS
jgi:hypothetical protein